MDVWFVANEVWVAQVRGCWGGWWVLWVCEEWGYAIINLHSHSIILYNSQYPTYNRRRPSSSNTPTCRRSWWVLAVALRHWRQSWMW